MEEPRAATFGTLCEPEQVEDTKRFFIKACAFAVGSLLVPEVAAKSVRHKRAHHKTPHTPVERLQSITHRRLRESRRVSATYDYHADRKLSRYPTTARVRELALFNTHTGESFRAPYWAYGSYQNSALKQFSYLLRDHHNNALHPIDPQLLDLLHGIQSLVEHDGPYHVLSAYRSPETNELLGRYHRGVAEHSMHLEGKAIDLRLPGCSLGDLRRAATVLRGGGVGYYPGSNFVHIDSGKIRYWES